MSESCAYAVSPALPLVLSSVGQIGSGHAAGPRGRSRRRIAEVDSVGVDYVEVDRAD